METCSSFHVILSGTVRDTLSDSRLAAPDDGSTAGRGFLQKYLSAYCLLIRFSPRVWFSLLPLPSFVSPGTLFMYLNCVQVVDSPISLPQPVTLIAVGQKPALLSIRLGPISVTPIAVCRAVSAKWLATEHQRRWIARCSCARVWAVRSWVNITWCL